MLDVLNLSFRVRCYGFESRKNRFPTGEVMVMLFVPLAVLI